MFCCYWLGYLRRLSWLYIQADPELEAIRQRRMQELVAQGSQQHLSSRKPKKKQKDERRQMMLTQILSSQAHERLARIALVKPEKA
ncbi:putative PDCD5-like superfamily protein [Helianthus annuus]|nr:putative PDCD5-like superfamily protein [Helianthus annuus]